MTASLRFRDGAGGDSPLRDGGGGMAASAAAVREVAPASSAAASAGIVGRRPRASTRPA